MMVGMRKLHGVFERKQLKINDLGGAILNDGGKSLKR